jgi:anti-anti-sigma factor
MHDFRVSVAVRPPLTVITVSGELDVTSEPQLREQVDEVLAGPPARLLFDLTELRFIDSSGIRVILDAYTRTRDTPGGVAVCGLNPHLRHLFAILGISPKMDIYPTASDAMSATHDR